MIFMIFDSHSIQAGGGSGLKGPLIRHYPAEMRWQIAKNEENHGKIPSVTNLSLKIGGF
jgi:hypothetical protein